MRYIFTILFSIYSSSVLSYVCNLSSTNRNGLILCTTFFFCLMVEYFTKINKQKRLAGKWLLINRVFKSSILFMIGGATYNLIEVLFRGYTHWSMFILGGLCFILIGILNELFTLSITSQMIISSGIIIGLEFIFGYILNIILGLDIWDYSDLPYNFMGQICLLFFNLWFLLSIVAILLDDGIRYILYDETKPKYYL